MSKQTYLYRIENKHNRLGPWSYNQGPRTYLETFRGHSPYSGLDWCREPFSADFRAVHVTFLAKKKMVALWFKKRHRGELKKAGFVVAKYRVTDPKKARIYHGSQQSIACKQGLEHVFDYTTF